jgi:hypothetical protein
MVSIKPYWGEGKGVFLEYKIVDRIIFYSNIFRQ